MFFIALRHTLVKPARVYHVVSAARLGTDEGARACAHTVVWAFYHALLHVAPLHFLLKAVWLNALGNADQAVADGRVHEVARCACRDAGLLVDIQVLASRARRRARAGCVLAGLARADALPVLQFVSVRRVAEAARSRCRRDFVLSALCNALSAGDIHIWLVAGWAAPARVSCQNLSFRARVCAHSINRLFAVLAGGNTLFVAL